MKDSVAFLNNNSDWQFRYAHYELLVTIRVKRLHLIMSFRANVRNLSKSSLSAVVSRVKISELLFYS